MQEPPTEFKVNVFCNGMTAHGRQLGSCAVVIYRECGTLEALEKRGEDPSDIIRLSWNIPFLVWT